MREEERSTSRQTLLKVTEEIGRATSGEENKPLSFKDKWIKLGRKYTLWAAFAFLIGMGIVLYALLGPTVFAGASIAPLLLTVGASLAGIALLLHLAHIAIQGTVLHQKWRSLSVARRVAAALFITAGLLLILAAVFLPAWPLFAGFFAASVVGGISVATVFIVGGVIIAGVAIVTHIFRRPSDAFIPDRGAEILEARIGEEGRPIDAEPPKPIGGELEEREEIGGPTAQGSVQSKGYLGIVQQAPNDLEHSDQPAADVPVKPVGQSDLDLLSPEGEAEGTERRMMPASVVAAGEVPFFGRRSPSPQLSAAAAVLDSHIKKPSGDKQLASTDLAAASDPQNPQELLEEPSSPIEGLP